MEKINWKFKEGAELQGSSNGFWYDKNKQKKEKNMNKKGYVMWGLPIVAVAWLGTAIAMVTFSQLPDVKDTHRKNKAIDVCLARELGQNELFDENGNVIASIPDRLAHEEDLISAATQEQRDYCYKKITKMNKERRLAYIEDK